MRSGPSAPCDTRVVTRPRARPPAPTACTKRSRPRSSPRCSTACHRPRSRSASSSGARSRSADPRGAPKPGVRESMSFDVTIPSLGESVTEATIGRWLKDDGDLVATDEAILELESDKANMDLAAEQAGVLHILKP